MKIVNNIRRLILFVSLSIVSLVLIFLFTASRKTVQALGDVTHSYLLFVVGLCIVEFVIEGVRLVFFVRGTGERIRLLEALKLASIAIFFNLITPFSFGGQPLLVYILRKEGIPSGKGSTIVITRLLTASLFIFMGAIFALVFFGHLISSVAALRTTFFITGILFIFLAGLTVTGLLLPRMMTAVARRLGRLLHHLHLVKDEELFLTKSIQHLYIARNSFQAYFGHRFGYLVGGTLCSGVIYFSQVLMLWAILCGLGVPIGFIEGFALSALFLFLIVFAPTPGSSGLGEIIFVIIFAGTVPKYLLGVAILLWRFFYQYLVAFLGGIVTAKYFSDLLVKDPKEIEKRL